MNEIAFENRLDRATTTSRQSDRAPAAPEIPVDEENDHLLMPIKFVGWTKTSRLIDASCKAFFLRRGLNPNGDLQNSSGSLR